VETNIGTIIDRIKVFLQISDNQSEVSTTGSKEAIEFNAQNVESEGSLLENRLVFGKTALVDKNSPLMLPLNNIILNLSDNEAVESYLNDIKNYQPMEYWANAHMEQIKYKGYSKIILEKMIPNINNKIIPVIQNHKIDEELNEAVAKLLNKYLIQSSINKLLIALRTYEKDVNLKMLLEETKKYISKLGYINLIVKDNTFINNQDFEWFAEYFEINGRGEMVKCTTSPAYFLRFINEDDELDYCVTQGTCIVDRA
jgi:hypothetical protein